MAKKATAAVLLLVVTAWAEMTMAPMIAMHAGHMRPGHEMASDMPAEHATHHHSQVAQAVARPCCPGLRKAEAADVLEVVSGAPACDDPHSCCFRPGPQSMPAPARDAQRLTPEMASTTVEISPFPVAQRALRNNPLELRPPPDLFGMPLRV